jgi:anti-sigma B factor antagonist
VSDLTIDVEPTATGSVLRLAGKLDHRTAPRVRDTLEHTELNAGQRLVVDLAGVTFCDSSGITALVAARNRALATQSEIALADVPAPVMRILRMTGLTAVFPFIDEA